MNKKYIALAMATAMTLLSGCSTVQNTAGSWLTVANPFTSVTNASDALTGTSSPQSGTTTTMFPGLPDPLGAGSQGFLVEAQADETGRKCYLYEGDEVCISFWLEGYGVFVEHGVGYLLFVDGKPQPYRTSADSEYSYMHGFKKDDYYYTKTVADPVTGENADYYRLDVDFIFEPVAGEKGDYVECQIVRLFYPDYSQEELGDQRIRPFTLAKNMISRSFVLKLAEAPPEAEELPLFDRLYDWELTTVDTTYSEIEGWSDDDMLKNVRTKCYINGLDMDKHNGMFWNVTKDDVIEIRFEIYGCPLLDFSLVYFVNNQPVSVSDEDFVAFRLNDSQKTIFTAKLDISDFDGESHLYFVLVPRNRRELDHIEGVSFTTLAGSYAFLRDDPEPTT